MLTGSLADEIKAQYEKNHWPCGKPTEMHTALDDLYSAERKENEVKEKAMSSDLFSESEDNKAGDGNCSESSGNGTQFANRTGIFSLDFLDSLKVPKGKGRKTKPTHVVPKKKEVEVDSTDSENPTTFRGCQVTFKSPNLKQRESDMTTTDSEATTVMPTDTQTQDLTLSIRTVPNSDSDVLIQPSGFITTCKHKRKSSSSCVREKLNKSQHEEPTQEDKGLGTT